MILLAVIDLWPNFERMPLSDLPPLEHPPRAPTRPGVCSCYIKMHKLTTTRWTYKNINDTFDLVRLLEKLRGGLVNSDTQICARERGRERGLRMDTERWPDVSLRFGCGRSPSDGRCVEGYRTRGTVINKDKTDKLH